MAAPVIPILKKVATAVLSDKKGRHFVLILSLALILLLISPVLLIFGLVNGQVDVPDFEIDESIKSEIEVIDLGAVRVGQLLTDKEYSEDDVKAGKAIYNLLIFQVSDKDISNRIVECFDSSESRSELIDNINLKFGTEITEKELDEAIKELEVMESA